MKSYILAILFCLPLRNIKVNSPYGYRRHPITGTIRFHAGTDLFARHDTVFAVLAGRVSNMNTGPELGLFIVLKHRVVQTIYGHLSQAFVARSDTVEAGQAIGLTGASGRVTGEHLHFAVLYRHHFIDPLLFLIRLLRQQESSATQTFNY
jgi:murein DD-endopeptidase MepM/ murein hydrolase activator NlpD